MFRKIRIHIAHKLLKEEVAGINLQRDAFKQASEQLTDREKSFEIHRNKVTYSDMMRESMKGFNPLLLDYVGSEDDILDSITEKEESVSDFLSNIKSISRNPAFKSMCKWIIRNQIIFTALDSENMDQVNFGRASVNGVKLVEDEVNRLALVYDERHTSEPEFDEHEVV